MKWHCRLNYLVQKHCIETIVLGHFSVYKSNVSCIAVGMWLHSQLILNTSVRGSLLCYEGGLC